MVNTKESRRRRLVYVVATLFATAACGRGAETAKPPEPAAQPAPAKPALANASSGRTPAKSSPIVQPVDPEVLKSVLAEVLGWTRGTPTRAMLSAPVAFSRAEARYERVPASVRIEVQDTALNQVLLAGMSMFLGAGFEERSADGYKKSGTYSGHPGFEEWRRDSQRGEISVIVANRFVVNGVGQRLGSMDELKQVIAALDIAKLASLR